MKRLLIIFNFMLIFSLSSISAFALQYGTDLLEPGNPGGLGTSLKTFDTTYNVSIGETFAIDIWLNDVPDSAFCGGFWVDFKGSTGTVTYVSAGRAFTDGSEGVVGPWPAGIGALVNEPAGKGTLMAIVSDLGFVPPDAGGDILVGRMTLQCTGYGIARVTVSTIPGFATWGPHFDDNDVLPTTLLIQTLQCPEGMNCSDGLFCNGTDNCSGGSCSIHSGNPCPETECNHCQEDLASCFDPAGTPCTDDGNICTNDVCSNGSCTHPYNNHSCDDGLWCTVNDLCHEGICSGLLRDCSSLSDQCNDGVCDIELDKCIQQAKPDGIACDDGLFCTVSDQCVVGFCQSGSPRDCSSGPWGQCYEGICDDDLDECVMGQPKPDGTPCEDGIFCNGSDSCIGGSCLDHAGDPCDYCSTYGCTCDENNDLCIGCYADDDCDGLCNPGESDPHCTGSDNCPLDFNPGQEDYDIDGIGDVCDNCPEKANGTILGTCVLWSNDVIVEIGDSCTGDYDCGNHEVCDMNQGDEDGDQLGNVCDKCPKEYLGNSCDCEVNFNCDRSVDGDDVLEFLNHFGRSPFFKPCTNENQCKGDVDCDGDVDADDVVKFLEDFGRSPFFKPCPACEVGDWCVYP